MGVAGGAHRTRTMDLVAYRTIGCLRRDLGGAGSCTRGRPGSLFRGVSDHVPAADFRTAISQGLFAPTAALAIAAVALGMLKAARRADDLLRRPCRQQPPRWTGRWPPKTLDRLVHDDVLTTLTAAAHAQDGAAVEATKSLASATLGKPEAPACSSETDGAVTLSGLVELHGPVRCRSVPPCCSGRHCLARQRETPPRRLKLCSPRREKHLNAMRFATHGHSTSL